MNRRRFLGVLAGAAVAPTLPSAARPSGVALFSQNRPAPGPALTLEAMQEALELFRWQRDYGYHGPSIADVLLGSPHRGESFEAVQFGGDVDRYPGLADALQNHR